MELETEFNEKFHNLSGSTVAEKKKSLNTFIKKLNEKIPEEKIKNVFVANLKPKNKLETVFKVDLLLHYKIYDVVLDLLLSGNLLYASMILKDWNFFKETFRNMSGTTFVNDILSYTSLAIRMKIINRTSKTLVSEERADEFFEAIEEKYGISSAEMMLPSCSLKMIKVKVQHYNLVLNHRQLLTIWKRDNEFVEFYFEYSHSKNYLNGGPEEYKILRVIFMRNEELFWKLHKKYYLNVSLGKRLSKKILRDNEELLKNVGNSSIRVKERQAYMQLRKNPEILKEFVLQRTPEEITEVFGSLTLRTTHIGKFIYYYISENKRYQFLNDSLKAKFGCNWHDKPEIVTESILRLMPEELRERVLRAKMKEGDDTSAYLLRPKVSVPLLKDKIKHSSDMHKRVSYISMLYKTCEFYKDEGYLLEVLKYVEERHRNDTNALEDFFRKLYSWVDIEDLSVDHWTYIDRIEKLLHLKGMEFNKDYFLEKRIAHRLNNNLDAGEQMRTYFELMTYWHEEDDIFTTIPKYRRYGILEMKKYIDETKDTHLLDKLLSTYLLWIFNHNKSTLLEDDISFLSYLPLLRTLLKTMLKTTSFYRLAQIVAFYVRTFYEEFNPIVWEYRDYFFQHFPLLSWYITNHKGEVLDKIDLISSLQGFENHRRFIRYLSLYSFRKIPEKIADSSVEAMQTDASLKQKITALNVLSMLEREEFLQISDSSHPNDDGIINTEDTIDKIKLQENILKNLKHWNMPVDLLQILSRFCIGDYLKYALQPLYSVVSRVSEKEAVSFLKKLHNSAVSVRKHVIHLSKFIYSFEEFCSFITKECVTEKNASLKTILFKKALGYAAKMPSTRTWELIKATMFGIDKDDVDSHDLLLRFRNVPEEYRAAYIPVVYSLLDTNRLPEIRRKKFNLIDDIPLELIDQLECILLRTFLIDILFNEDAGSVRSNKWIQFILHSTGVKRDILFDFALSKLAEYNNSRPNDFIDYNQSNFMLDLHRGFLEFRPSYSMLNKFSTMWLSKFPPEIDIDYHYRVIFTLAFAKCEYDVKKFPVKIIKLLKDFPPDETGYLFKFFLKNLYGFLELLRIFIDIHIHEFVEIILAIEESIPVHLISIHVLSLTEPEKEEDATRYISLLQKLKGRPELCIKIHYRKYLYDFEQRLTEKFKFEIN